MNTRLNFIIVSTILFMTIASAGEVLGLTLADGGTTDYVIAVADDAIPAEVTAGDELQAYLEQVTGAVFPIHNEAGAPPAASKIYVGPSTTAKSLAPEIDTADLGHDGIVIKSVGQDLVLAGGRTRGTIYAVYTFLQDEIGCRWYEHDAPEVIPNTPTLVIGAQNTVYRPPFDYRRPNSQSLYGYAGPWAPPDGDVPFEVKLRLNPVYIDEQYGGGTGHGGAHTMLDWVLPPSQYFATNPEWYRDDSTGTRVPDAVCYMVPGARVQAAANVIAKLDADYATMGTPKVISVSHPDGPVHCRDPLCVHALEVDPGYIVDSGPLLDFVNYIAEQVEPVYPDVFVSTLAFFKTAAPPWPGTITARDNVIVQFALNNEALYPAYPPNGLVHRDFRKPFGDTPFGAWLTDWNVIAPNLYIWDYDTNFTNMIQPHPTYFAFPKSLPFYRDNGASGVFSQGSWSNAGDFVRMKCWVNAQMLWDPNQDVDALMDEFLGAYYGAAGPHLKQYLDLMDSIEGRLGDYSDSTSSWLGLADLNQATTYFNQAEDAVAGDAELTLRVRRCRLGIDTVWLQEYRQLRQDAVDLSLPFKGVDDPYIETDRIAQDEFDAGTYYEWGGFGKYIGLLYGLFPQRTASAPDQARYQAPYRWEERQQDLLVSTPSGHALEVNDSNASNGQALMLPSSPSNLEAYYELPATMSGGRTTVPTNFAGQYQVYADIRAEPSGQSGTVVAGLSNPGGDGAVNSVALAGAGGLNYVFFTADDPNEDEMDTEVFVQVVDQNGTLIGSFQQLTFDSADQYWLDAVEGNGTIHLVYQTDPGTGDSGLKVGYMAVSPGGPEAVTIDDHRLDLYGAGPTRYGRIAMRSDGQPVVVLGARFSPFRFFYTQDLTNWETIVDWVSGGSVDIAVDSNDRAHIAWANAGLVTHPEYRGQTGPGYNQWGPIEQVGSQVWTSGKGQVKIAANNDGVHVGWHPRLHLGGGDASLAQFHYRVKSGGSWSATTSLENGNVNLSPSFLASADELYYFSLWGNAAPNGGPYYQLADDGVNNAINLYQGLTTGLMQLDDVWDLRLAPAWNGSEMNLASVEMKTQTSGKSTLVALYLDILCTVSEVVVYLDSADHTVAAQFTAAGANTYQTLDLGTHDLADKARIWVRPEDDINATYIDRIFLVPPAPVPPPATCAEALLAGYRIVSDSDDDCYVQTSDFADVAQNYGDLSELLAIIADWLSCIDPANATCTHPWE